MSRMSAPARLRLWTSLLALGTLSLACKSQSEELPEWTPRDHDQEEKAAAPRTDTSQARPEMAKLEQQGINDLILATWKQSCSSCHGIIGRGDGPAGPALKVPDLTDPELQAQLNEARIEESILKGRGKMPANPSLPRETVTGLVKLVRLLNRKPQEAGPGPERSSAASPSQNAQDRSSTSPVPQQLPHKIPSLPPSPPPHNR